MGKFRVVRTARYQELKRRERAFGDLNFLKALPADKVSQALQLLSKSTSQIRQDIFVATQLDFMRDGFFVEFGATNGIELSNSLMFEREFGWSGILAEPDIRQHADLKVNRTAKIDARCVSAKSGETVSFTATARGENSGMAEHVMMSRRLRGTTYDVETVSLNDLLLEHNAPDVIDYISIDTEGSEAMILDAFDFDRWRFRVATIEHNFEPQRETIHALMTQNGYVRLMEEFSQFDDWYIHPDIASQ